MISFLHLFSVNSSYEIVNSFLSQDSMTSVLISLTLWISIIMILASQNRVKIAKNSFSHFTFIILALNIILVVAFYINSVMLFYFFFEASLIPTLLLILG